MHDLGPASVHTHLFLSGIAEGILTSGVRLVQERVDFQVLTLLVTTVALKNNRDPFSLFGKLADSRRVAGKSSLSQFPSYAWIDDDSIHDL